MPATNVAASIDSPNSVKIPANTTVAAVSRLPKPKVATVKISPTISAMKFACSCLIASRTWLA